MFSCVLVWLGRVWLFGSGEVELSDISLDGGLLLLSCFICVGFRRYVLFLIYCSVLIPVWMVTHRNIAIPSKGRIGRKEKWIKKFNSGKMWKPEDTANVMGVGLN